MKRAADLLSDASLLAFAVLAVVCLARWRAHRTAPLAWATATFGSLTGVAVYSFVVGEDAEPSRLVAFALISLLAAFPYFLFRFAVSFERTTRRLEWIAASATALVVAVSAFVPRLPREDEPRPAWLLAYTGLFVAQWTLLFVVSAVRLWRGGAGQPTVARRRMRLLAMGAAGMNVAIIVSAFTPPSAPAGLELTSAVLTLVTAGSFFLGIAPPPALRVLWRQPEQGALGAAIGELLGVTTSADVAATILPYTRAILGARGAALFDRDGRAIGTHGRFDPEEPTVERVAMRWGSLAVVASPYAPFFGPEERQLLERLGAFIDLALDRVVTFEREKEFIANAAHELRTPLATITGLAATLFEHRDRMSSEKIDECLTALDRQGTRAVALVNNLLDLAHVQHSGVTLEGISLEKAVFHAVEAAPAPADVDVRVTVPEDVVVQAEAGRLEQVLTNLLVNAYRYGGKAIEVAAHLDGDVLVRVSDDGPGVPSELEPRLFEPFTRARGATVWGSGLGLAISRRLARAFGGDLWYEAGPDGGATFVMRLERAR